MSLTAETTRYGKSEQDCPFSMLSAMPLHSSWPKHAPWVQERGFPCVPAHNSHWGWSQRYSKNHCTGEIGGLIGCVCLSPHPTVLKGPGNGHMKVPGFVSS